MPTTRGLHGPGSSTVSLSQAVSCSRKAFKRGEYSVSEGRCLGSRSPHRDRWKMLRSSGQLFGARTMLLDHKGTHLGSKGTGTAQRCPTAGGRDGKRVCLKVNSSQWIAA